MAEAAGSKALAASGRRRRPTSTSSSSRPARCRRRSRAAPELAYRLGIDAPGAYDVNSGCSGFVYALNAGLGRGARRPGRQRARRRVRDDSPAGSTSNDRSTCIILGDGAGAAVVGRPTPDEVGIGPVVWGSDGEQSATDHDRRADALLPPGGPGGLPLGHQPDGPGRARGLPRAPAWRPRELAAFIPHQANLRIIEAIAKKLGVTDARRRPRHRRRPATPRRPPIPLALSRMVERGEIASGEPVLLLGFGSGLAYAGQVVLAP